MTALVAEPPRPTIDVPRSAGGFAGLLGVHPGLLVFGAALLLVPRVLPKYWVFSVAVGLVLAISCLGLLVVVGWVREISLAQAGLTGTSVYITGYLLWDHDFGSRGGGLPFPLAAAIGIGVTAGLSLLVALVSVRLAGAYVIVLTLALQFALENTVMINDRLSGGLSSPTTPRPSFFGYGMYSDDQFYYFVLGALAVSTVFLYRLRISRFGRSLILVGSDKQAAAAAGVSPWTYKVWAFVIAGAFAGLAGALSAPLYFSPPGTLQYISFNSLFYLAIPVVAGFDSLSAVVGVAILFTLIPQVFLDAKINVYLVGGVGLCVGVLLGPRGVAGSVSDLFDRRRRRVEVAL